MEKKLTIKQEKFCQAYVRTSDKSAAYREAYNAQNMKAETINNKAYHLFTEAHITARVNEIHNETRNRNKITLDEIVDMLAGMARFDVSDIYDDSGFVKPLSAMKKETRQMITRINSTELYSGKGSDKESIGVVKEVVVADKHASLDKLLKIFGGYEKDNEQKKSEQTVNFDMSKISDATLNELEAASGE